jgi:hypothetical protein
LLAIRSIEPKIIGRDPTGRARIAERRADSSPSSSAADIIVDERIQHRIEVAALQPIRMPPPHSGPRLAPTSRAGRSIRPSATIGAGLARRQRDEPALRAPVRRVEAARRQREIGEHPAGVERRDAAEVKRDRHLDAVEVDLGIARRHPAEHEPAERVRDPRDAGQHLRGAKHVVAGAGDRADLVGGQLVRQRLRLLRSLAADLDDLGPRRRDELDVQDPVGDRRVRAW